MVTILIAVAAFSSIFTVSTEQAFTTTDAWQRRMNEMADAMRVLVPLLSDPVRFNDPANSETITSSALSLSALSHLIAQSEVEPGVSNEENDPSLRFFGDVLSESTGRAFLAYQHGQKDYARRLLKGTAQQCIACHTRGNLDVSMQSLRALGPIAASATERAEISIAVRRFADAKSAYAEVLRDTRLAKESPEAWLRAARGALALEIRVFNDPLGARSVARMVAISQTKPTVRALAAAWIRSIDAWETDTTPRNPLDLAGALVQDEGTEDSSGLHDVDLLRASALLHDYLRGARQPNDSSLALYYLGRCYGALGAFDLWENQESYFRACIETSPHSTIARSCYLKYEESVFEGYLDGGALSLPVDIYEDLTRLEHISQPTVGEF